MFWGFVNHDRYRYWGFCITAKKYVSDTNIVTELNKIPTTLNVGTMNQSDNTALNNEETANNREQNKIVSIVRRNEARKKIINSIGSPVDCSRAISA